MNIVNTDLYIFKGSMGKKIVINILLIIKPNTLKFTRSFLTIVFIILLCNINCLCQTQHFYQMYESNYLLGHKTNNEFTNLRTSVVPTFNRNDSDRYFKRLSFGLGLYPYSADMIFITLRYAYPLSQSPRSHAPFSIGIGSDISVTLKHNIDFVLPSSIYCLLMASFSIDKTTLSVGGGPLYFVGLAFYGHVIGRIDYELNKKFDIGVDCKYILHKDQFDFVEYPLISLNGTYKVR